VSTHFRIARTIPRFVAAAGGSTYDSAVSALSPVADWGMDDTTGTVATAIVGTNGTYFGGPTLGASVLVNDGRAGSVVCNGTDDEVQLPLPTLATAGTLVMWWRWIDDIHLTSIIWRDDTSAGGTGWFLDVAGGGSGSPAVRVNGTSHTVSGVTTTSLQTGVRHMFGIATDGTTVRFNIDGTTVDSWSKSAALSTLVSPLHLGRNGKVTGTSAYFTSGFDRTHIFNTSLSDTNFGDLWNAGK